MFAMLKQRNFALLFTGNAVSRIGSAFYNFAIGWYILTITASPLAMGLYIAVGVLVELIISPIAGVFIDRLNKVRILYITDFIRGIAVLIGAMFIFLLDIEIGLLVVLYGVTIILGINNAFFFPATQALLPEIVDDERLNRANAFFSLINSVQAIIGVLLAGILYAILGIEWIFIINALTFIVSGISEMFIEAPENGVERDTTMAPNFKGDLIDGFRYIRDKTGLLAFMLCALMLNFAAAPLFANALPYVYNLVLGREAIDLSIANVTFSVGMLIGGLVVGALGTKVIVKRAIRQGLAMTATMMYIMGLLLYLVTSERIVYGLFVGLLLPTLFILAFSQIWLNVPFNTGILRAVDANKRGRVLSILNTISAALMPLSFALGGVVLEFIGLPFMVVSVFIISFIPLLIMLFGKQVTLLLEQM